MMTMAPKRFYSTANAALELGVSTKTVARVSERICVWPVVFDKCHQKRHIFTSDQVELLRDELRRRKTA